MCSPLQLSAPQYVLLPVHQNREVLILPLFDGVGACCDGAHLPELQKQQINSQTCATMELQVGTGFPFICGYQTFATLPCSRQSCSSSLSIPEAHRGLKQGGGTTFSSASINRTQRCFWVEFPGPTCSFPAGFPRSSAHGEQQRPRWRRSSRGYTAK